MFNLNFSQVIKEIAHKKLVQKPQYVAECWKDTLIHLPSFLNFACLSGKYDALEPTATRSSMQIHKVMVKESLEEIYQGA